MIPHRVVITPGEPAGIGPDLVVQLAQRSWPVELVVCADATLLQDRAALLGLPLTLLTLKANSPHRSRRVLSPCFLFRSVRLLSPVSYTLKTATTLSRRWRAPVTVAFRANLPP